LPLKKIVRVTGRNKRVVKQSDTPATDVVNYRKMFSIIKW